jgi:hypothetical protein
MVAETMALYEALERPAAVSTAARCDAASS